MNKQRRLNILISLLILPPMILFLAHLIFPPSFLFSSLYKIIFLLPIFYRLIINKRSIHKSFNEGFSFENLKTNILPVVGIGIAFSAIYLGSFFLLENVLNLEKIATNLTQTVSTDAKNIIFIGLYIIIFNSLLEEFFWRGFIYNELKNTISPWIACVLTGFAFSFHHIVFYYSWFNAALFCFTTIGLIGYAIFMNLIFDKYKDLWSCWIIHAMVDTVQIYIGLKIFKVI